MTNRLNLTTGSMVSQLARIASLVLFGMLMFTFYLLTDLFFVSRLGSDAVAALSISGNAFFAYLGLSFNHLDGCSLIAQTTLRSQITGSGKKSIIAIPYAQPHYRYGCFNHRFSYRTAVYIFFRWQGKGISLGSGIFSDLLDISFVSALVACFWCLIPGVGRYQNIYVHRASITYPEYYFGSCTYFRAGRASCHGGKRGCGFIIDIIGLWSVDLFFPRIY
jgi:hypothetical protein